MEERDRPVQPEEFEPNALSLRGFHAIGAVSTFLEMARKVHMPRKKASAMFSTNTARINRLR